MDTVLKGVEARAEAGQRTTALFSKDVRSNFVGDFVDHFKEPQENRPPTIVDEVVRRMKNLGYGVTVSKNERTTESCILFSW